MVDKQGSSYFPIQCALPFGLCFVHNALVHCATPDRVLPIVLAFSFFSKTLTDIKTSYTSPDDFKEAEKNISFVRFKSIRFFSRSP